MRCNINYNPCASVFYTLLILLNRRKLDKSFPCGFMLLEVARSDLTGNVIITDNPKFDL